MALLGNSPVSVKLMWQLTGIVCGVSFLSIFLFFPETRYPRKSVMGEETAEQESRPSTEKEAVETTESQQHTPAGTKKTFFQELKPWSPLNTESNYIGLLLRPWPMLVYPATLYSYLTFSAQLAFYICIYATYASVFQLPPYSMSTGVSGLINISASIGCFIGAYCGGALTDTFIKYRARRNKGIFEPETRLVAMIMPFFLVPVGLLMYIPSISVLMRNRYGLGVQNQTSWAVPFVGTGFVGFGLTAVPTITMTYGSPSQISSDSSDRFVLARGRGGFVVD